MCCEPKAKIYVVSHMELGLREDGILCPIRADRTDGDNIAWKENYCELRAQYWVWKNTSGEEEDYVGFFHYRRYLDLESGAITAPSAAWRPTPYRIQRTPPAGGSLRDWEEKLREFDVIAPIWEYTGMPVEERYGKSGKERRRDLETVREILLEKYPVFAPAAEKYLQGEGEYYGNIYIMRRKYFQAYCAWLFDILEEFDRRTENAPRFADGYLGERLFGIYFTWLSGNGGVRCGELPRVHFAVYDDATHRSLRTYLVNLLLPPGSRLRGFARRLKYAAFQKG